MPVPADVPKTKRGARRMPRQPKLRCDAETLGKIRDAGKFALSPRETAGKLGVKKDTYEAFLEKYPEAAQAYEEGFCAGNNSLKMIQYTLALKGNVTMGIWLGKQRLGQADKVEATGKDGAPLVPAKHHVTFSIARPKPVPPEDEDK